MAKIRTPAIVLIEWRDAAHEFGWMEGNAIDDDEPELTCFTVGWILKKTKLHVKVCQTYSSDNHAQTIVIPRGMIRSMINLKTGTSRHVK
jgi:hypothetical protein